MAKILKSSREAAEMIQEGAVLMTGGFGVCGVPENILHHLADLGTKGLTIISNNGGIDNWGNGRLLRNGQVKKMYASYIGENKDLEAQFLDGSLEVELVPQGTLAERIRAAGAGIAAFFTPTGFGTKVAEGKETREFNGRGYVLEQALPADFALVKAYKADKKGNLVFRKTARNFNPVMAAAGKITIVEVEELVEVGELDPEAIITPSIFVDYIVKGENYERLIEQRTNRS